MSSTKSYTPLDEISQFPKKTFTISATGRAFVNNDPNSLTYGNIPLKQYLEENGETGAFINRHSEQIQGDFFIALTKSILKKTGISCNTVAGDGTVIEAACSYYNLLKEEGALINRKKAEEELACAPDDPIKQKNLEEAQEVEKILGKHIKKATDKGRKSKNVCINPKETDAFVHRGKRARGAIPAYVVGVLANEDRIIVGHDVHPSNEASMVSKKLNQVSKIAGEVPKNALFDTGYFYNTPIEECTKRGIKIYCAEKKGTPFTKNQFRYNSDNNSYTCPAGNILTAVKREKNRTIYATEACGSCPARLKCTTSIKGRSIHRYPFDEKKEKVVARMKQDGAKQLYTSRAGLVEPVFLMLRGLQQFNRFRRRGLASVRLEFSIQALAYNINRLITLLTSKNNPKPFPSVPKRAVIAISITFCSQIMKITCIWHFSLTFFQKSHSRKINTC